MKQIAFKSKCKINAVDVTEDTLTGRGGKALLVRYLSQVNIYGLLRPHFPSVMSWERYGTSASSATLHAILLPWIIAHNVGDKRPFCAAYK